jgi:hypothetical protein
LEHSERYRKTLANKNLSSRCTHAEREEITVLALLSIISGFPVLKHSSATLSHTLIQIGEIWQLVLDCSSFLRCLVESSSIVHKQSRALTFLVSIETIIVHPHHHCFPACQIDIPRIASLSYHEIFFSGKKVTSRREWTKNIQRGGCAERCVFRDSRRTHRLAECC